MDWKTDISEPLRHILFNESQEPTGMMAFYDDTWVANQNGKKSQYIVGSGIVDIDYFKSNPIPNGVLRRSINLAHVDNSSINQYSGYKSRTGRKVGSVYMAMLDAFAELIDEDYSRFGKEIKVMVACNMFGNMRDVSYALSKRGYDLSQLPRILPVTKTTIRLPLKKIVLEKREYRYKQRTGTYAQQQASGKG